MGLLHGTKSKHSPAESHQPYLFESKARGEGVGVGGGRDVTWQVTYKGFRYIIKYRRKDLQERFSSPAICRLKEGMSASNN